MEDNIKNLVIPKNSNNKFSTFFSIFLISILLVYIFLLIFNISLPLPIVFLVTFLFCIPIGYASLLPIQNHFQAFPNFVKLIVFSSVGYAFSMLWTFFLSTFTVKPIALFSLLIISSTIIFFSIYNNKTERKTKKNRNFHSETHLKYSKNKWFNISTIFSPKFAIKNQNVILVTTFLILFIFIMWKIQLFGWAPEGDAMTHSYWIGVQIFEGSRTFQVPFDPSGVINYPLGLHFFAANLSILYNLSPPQTLLIIGSLSIFLLSTTIMSIVYIITRSSWLSIIALFSTFFLHSSKHIDYVWHSFNIGQYPNLTGFFFLFLLVLILLLIRNNVKLPHILFLFIFVIFGIIVYPTTLGYSFLFLGAFVASRISIKEIKKIPSLLKKILFQPNKKNWLGFYPHFFVVIAIGTILENLPVFYYKLITHFSSSVVVELIGKIYSGYNMFQFTDDWFFNTSLFVGIIASIYLIVYQKQDRFIGYLTLGFITLQISGNYLGPFQILLSTVRFSLLLPIFSWITACVAIYLLWNKDLAKINIYFESIQKNSRKRRFSKNAIILCFGLITFLIVTDGGTAIFRENGDSSMAFASLQPHFEAIDWISNNVYGNDLIWNHQAGIPDNHPYFWINAIEYKFQTNGMIGTVKDFGPNEREQFNNLLEYNYRYAGTLQTHLEKNDIKYLITESQKERDEVLQSYEFLDVVFQNEHDIIFKVRDDKPFSLTKFKSLKLVEARQMENTDPDAAIILYEDIINLDSLEMRAWQGKIRVLIEGEKYEKAFSVYDELIETLDYQRNFQILDEETISNLYQKTVYIKEQGKIRELIEGEKYEKAFSIFGDLIETLDYQRNFQILDEETISNFYQKTVYIKDIVKKELEERTVEILEVARQMENTDPDAAIILYEDIINLDSLEMRAWQGKIRVLVEGEQYEKAFSAYDDLIKILDNQRNFQKGSLKKYELFNNYYQDSLKAKILLAENIEEHNTALRIYDKLLGENKFDIVNLKGKAELLYKMEEFMQAKIVYELIFALEPDSEEIKQRLEELNKKFSD